MINTRSQTTNIKYIYIHRAVTTRIQLLDNMLRQKKFFPLNFQRKSHMTEKKIDQGK